MGAYRESPQMALSECNSGSDVSLWVIKNLVNVSTSVAALRPRTTMCKLRELPNPFKQLPLSEADSNDFISDQLDGTGYLCGK